MEVCDAADEIGGQGGDHLPIFWYIGYYAHNTMYYPPSRIFRYPYGPVTEAGFSSESFLHGR